MEDTKAKQGFISAKDVRKQRGVSQRTIARQIEQGYLPPYTTSPNSTKPGWESSIWNKFHYQLAIDQAENETRSHILEESK